LTLNIGCSGWSYEGWKGIFYPNKMENKDYLPYYSKFFKFVEVDSTYYHTPSRYTVRGWKDKTSEDFKFSLKFPKIITHERKLEDIIKPLSALFYSEPLIDKTLTLLIQLPPFLSEKRVFTSVFLVGTVLTILLYVITMASGTFHSTFIPSDISKQI
jgi:uncharacterized protein YecE (DUF72 family)